MKNVDEMSFRCPLVWTVAQLKIFIVKNHKNGNDYLRRDKLNLMYQGNILSDEQVLADILGDVKTKLMIFTFV